MTERDFMLQVWRPYDSVVIDGSLKVGVTQVCFPTRSVRVNIPTGGNEWVRCERIEKHISSSGRTEDLGIIEELRETVAKKDKQIADLTQAVNNLKEKQTPARLEALIRTVNVIKDGLVEKKKRMENIEKGLESIDEILALMKEETKEE